MPPRLLLTSRLRFSARADGGGQLQFDELAAAIHYIVDPQTYGEHGTKKVREGVRLAATGHTHTHTPQLPS